MHFGAFWVVLFIIEWINRSLNHTCRKVHFRRESFSSSNSASQPLSHSVSPSVCLQSQYFYFIFFRFDIPCGKAVITFHFFSVCYSSDLLSLWLLFHFSSPKTELRERRSLVEFQCQSRHFFDMFVSSLSLWLEQWMKPTLNKALGIHPRGSSVGTTWVLTGWSDYIL